MELCHTTLSTKLVAERWNFELSLNNFLQSCSVCLKSPVTSDSVFNIVVVVLLASRRHDFSGLCSSAFFMIDSNRCRLDPRELMSLPNCKYLTSIGQKLCRASATKQPIGQGEQKHATANRRDGWSAVTHMHLAKAAENRNRK